MVQGPAGHHPSRTSTARAAPIARAGSTTRTKRGTSPRTAVAPSRQSFDGL